MTLPFVLVQVLDGKEDTLALAATHNQVTGDQRSLRGFLQPSQASGRPGNAVPVRDDDFQTPPLPPHGAVRNPGLQPSSRCASSDEASKFVTSYPKTWKPSCRISGRSEMLLPVSRRHQHQLSRCQGSAIWPWVPKLEPYQLRCKAEW